MFFLFIVFFSDILCVMTLCQTVVPGIVGGVSQVVSAGAATHLISIQIRHRRAYLGWLLGHLTLEPYPYSRGCFWLLQMDLMYDTTILTRN